MMSSETRKKIGLAKRGVPNPAISVSNRLRARPAISPLKGRKQPKISAALLGRSRPDISARLKGRPNPKVSLALKGRPRPDVSDRMKGKKNTTLALWNRGRRGKPHSRRHQLAVLKSLAQHPNRLERAVLVVLVDAFPAAGWMFNSDTVVAGKMPDFVRGDGLLLVVDVHGDYWHRDETVTDIRRRQRYFLKNGYRLVVVWEHEFKRSPSVLLKRVRQAEHRCRLASAAL